MWPFPLITPELLAMILLKAAESVLSRSQMLCIKMRIIVITYLCIRCVDNHADSQHDDATVPLYHNLKPFQGSFISFWSSLASGL